MNTPYTYRHAPCTLALAALLLGGSAVAAAIDSGTVPAPEDASSLEVVELRDVAEETMDEAAIEAACIASVQMQPVDPGPCTLASQALIEPDRRAVALSILAVQHLHLDDPVVAAETLEEALTLAPRNPYVQANAGTFYLHANDFSGAIAAFGHAQALAGDDIPAVYLNRAIALRGIGRYAEARADYDYYEALVRPASTAWPQTVPLDDGPVREERVRSERMEGESRRPWEIVVPVSELD